MAAEVLYPSVGMEICNIADLDLKQACMDAYNLWLAEYCAQLYKLDTSKLKSLAA